MQPRLIPLVLALSLAGLTAVPVRAGPGNGTAAELLASARMWDAKERPDLARAMLEKLLTIETSPEALLLLGSIELRSGNTKIAGEYLRRLEQSYPQHPDTQALRSLYRVYTTEKQSLARARLLARAGKSEEAAAIMRQLFPQGPPPGELGLEYYQLVATTPGDRQAAKTALAGLYRETGEARYRLAWLRMQGAGKQETLQAYEAMAAARDVDRKRLQADWWDALNRLPTTPAALPWVRRYLKEFPDSRKAIDYLADLQRLQEQAIRIASDPAVRARKSGLALLEQGQLADAARELQSALSKRPKDPDVLGGIGMLELRQGHHADAISWFRRAANAEPGSSKWRSLIRTASFWGQMKRASSMLEAGKLPEAQAAARLALSIDPENADGLALLGNILAKANDFAGAEAMYRDALKKEAGNSAAMRGLLAMLSASGRRDEAQTLIAEFRRNNPQEAERYNQTQAGLLRDEADAYLSAHRPSHALLALETAVLLAPRDPWIRHDLANLYESLGLPLLGRRVMAEGAALAPDDPGMNYAYALVLTAQENEEEALQRLALIPASARSSSMNELETRAWINWRVRQARAFHTQGREPEATQMLLLAERRAADQPNRMEQVAEGWFGIDQPARGLLLMKRQIDAKTATADSRLYYASLLNRAKQDLTLNAYLPNLFQEANWNDAQRATLLEIETDLASRQIERLLQNDEQNQARALAARPAISGRGGETATMKARARLLLEANDEKNVLPVLQAILEKKPEDLETQLNLAQAYFQLGDKAAAQAAINRLLPLVAANDVELRSSIARLDLRLGNIDAARQLLAPLLIQNPDNPDVLIQAGRIEKRDRKYQAALSLFRQALALEGRRKTAGAGTESEAVPLLEPAAERPIAELALRLAYTLAYPEPGKREAAATKPESSQASDPLLLTLAAAITMPETPPLAPPLPEPEKTLPNRRPSRAEEEIAGVEGRRDPRIETGLEKLDKDSSDGTSSYHGIEAPTVGWWPVGYDGHGFVHVDHIKIDAGALSTNTADANLFGKIAATQFVLGAPAPQRVDGTSVGIGYQGDDLRWDVGVIGIGFPLQNLVGGVRKSWEAGKIDYALEFARRPQTGSLLSYAGARDPATGEIWGGVTNTGLSARASTSVGQLYSFASLEYDLLRGKNVLDNNRVALRAGVDRDLLRRDDLRLNLGLTLTHWRFRENESFYTFGHGGYYSPQRYTSISLPLDFAGRVGKLSYQLQASVSRSKTDEKDMPYYPTDNALQAVGNNVYSGGSGGGFGHSMRLAAQYQLTPHLSLGGKYEVERSDFYAPNSAFIYLRYTFQPQLDPVRFPPAAVKPYSEF